MKNSLREIYISKRKNLLPDFITNSGYKIVDIYKTSFLTGLNNFMSYIPIKNEAPVNELNRALINNGKTVSVPLTENNDSLTPVIYSDFNNTVLGKYNIPEPKVKNIMDPNEIEVVFVPGVVFDKSGNRIGYGKGCYDRFLGKGTYIKIGVCYEFQIVDNISSIENYDVKMDYLLTEKDLYEV